MFHHSCSVEQKWSYLLLREALLKRFTAVHIQSVQWTVFHHRSQRPADTVDEYAQELKILFRRVYPKLERTMKEKMSVLTLRFVAGLRNEIQRKMAVERIFDQVLSRA